jgi:methanogenic corrinoid protein MtbC1
MIQINHNTWSQSEVEQRTGLSREVLRKWELRYQYPRPGRGLRGQRHYTRDEVDKLILISQLLKHGLRAGVLVPMSTPQLQGLLDRQGSIYPHPTEPSRTELAQAVQSLLVALAPTSDASAIESFLQTQLARYGLAVFVAHQVPTFNCAVGDAWLTQRLSIAAEHRYTSCLRQVVLRALPPPSHANTRPRVLLTTPPCELHSLGLLALHAQLSLQGADCIDLGSQTPLAELLQAVTDLQIGVVAISVSICLAPVEIQQFVQKLVAGMPNDCVLWVGGQGCTALQGINLPACTVFADTTSAVQRWLALAKAHRIARGSL